MLAASSVLVLAGCAGNPPTTEMAVANQALNAAETAGATEFAPVEIQSARTKMNDAEKAAFEKDYKKAKISLNKRSGMLVLPSAKLRQKKLSAQLKMQNMA